MGTIYVLPIGRIEQETLQFLSKRIELIFNCNSTILEGIGKPSYAFNRNRNQYSAHIILKEIIHLTQDDAQKIIGVANIDLHIPILTFVFGLAQLDGNAAIMSLYRLRQEYYGLPSNRALLLERATKEAVHEIGHTFGLTHCLNNRCVMHTSNSVRKVDNKDNSFCNSCSTILKLKSKKIESED
ncbi:MAG: archaemetzincin family Zn-dependent metalloprotease [Candidatus Cloacimonetes bacterium]|nr:archaemetzincin family Zn-dependent metalloprotease [Candidatus Cloacimonadota bacterium]